MRRRRWPWAVGAGIVLAAIGVTVAVMLIPSDPGGTLRTVPSDVDAATARIRAVLPDVLDDANVPGAAVAIVADGRPVWSEGFGSEDNGAPVTSDTLFQVGSISKPIAAATILRLVHEGVLDLDTEVTGHLGDWTLPGDSRGVTLRRLLSHTAGTTIPGYLGASADRPPATTVESLEGLSNSDPVTGSGVGHVAYSGGGYTVAQLAAETATGRPFSELATELVLHPLEMDSSGYTCTTADPDAAILGHDIDGRFVPHYLYPEAAAAGLCSTADDLALFVASLVSGSPDARLMATPQEGTDGRYGLGLELGGSAEGDPVVEHPGVNRGYVAYIAAVPAAGFGIAILTNGDGGDAVIDAVLEALRD